MIPETHLAALFFNRVQRWPDRPLLSWRKGGHTLRWTWQETADQVTAIAHFLVGLKIGPQEPCGLISENRPEWSWVDLGVLTSANYDVPLYPTSTSEEILYCLNDCRARILFLSSEEQLQKIAAVEGFFKYLRTVVTFDPVPARLKKLKQILLSEILKEGARLAGGGPAEQFSGALATIEPHALASVIYTSGTTGTPKGVMLTHDNILFNVESSSQMLPITEADVYLSFLPLNHVFERMAGLYLMMKQGAQITYVEKLDTLAQEIPIVRPTLMCGVPRFFEKIQNGIRTKVAQGGPVKQKLFQRTLDLGRKRVCALERGEGLSFLERLETALLNRLVASKVRRGFGGRLRFFVSGGAALGRALPEFFYALGLTILEGYGLTETSPVITVNRPDRFRFGTVGLAIPGVEVRIAPDGEILTRGRHVMKGYLGREEDTRAVIEDGWFATGDIGQLDKDGFLTITDRKKDLIVTSGGKKVAPQLLENLLKADPAILQVHLHGNARRYMTALVVPNFEVLVKKAEERSIAYSNPKDLVENKDIQNWMASSIAERLQAVAPYQKIKYIQILADEFTLEKGELTPTLKLKRRVIDERYQRLIDGMYQDPPQGIAVP
ncbi:MAG: long-chain fatty acid--CoA ligase [Candidatus Omnitrophica bacterium]|nr:long-chain fatty acid--CoA ligase [Candidatus Omnitrophota bacterium]